MRLSEKMLETMQVLEKYKALKRYDGGFWSWDSADMKPSYNGGQIICMVPSWYCDVKTLRALAKRNLVVLDENNKTCKLEEKNY